MKNVKIGDIVHVRFHDHCRYGGRGRVGMYLEIDAYGQVMHVSDKSLEIGSWVTRDDQDSDNDESFSILKSTIIFLRRLGRTHA